MAPVKTLEQERTVEVRVREEECRTFVNTTPKPFTKSAIEALVNLGYPIGRYLSSVQASDTMMNSLPRIYARMKVTFYQNRGEFLRLKTILQSRLENVGNETLREMALHAQVFTHLWTPRDRAEASMQELKKFL